jgi:hypothetical protein
MACEVRLMNELPLGSPDVSLQDASGQALASASPWGASAYTPVACGQRLAVAAAGLAGANTTLPPAPRASVLVRPGAGGLLAAAGHPPGLGDGVQHRCGHAAGAQRPAPRP